jgi:hypothetical protein
MWNERAHNDVLFPRQALTFRTKHEHKGPNKGVVMMLQMIATMASILIGAGAMTVIAMALAEDWTPMLQAVGFRPTAGERALPPQSSQAERVRRIRVLQVSPVPVPWRAAA